MKDATASQPFFSNRPPDSRRPRLMLVSYYFPPRQSAGALRWSKLSHYLHEIGWDIDVLMSPPAKWSVDSTLRELPPSISLYAVEDERSRLRRLEDAVAAWRKKARSRGRGSTQNASEAVVATSRSWIPTSELRWIPRSPRDLVRIYKALVEVDDVLTWATAAERVASSLASRNEYVGVLSSAPPWSTVIAAQRIGSEHSLPVVHDFRDPWALPQQGLMEKTAHPLAWLLQERLEAASIASATMVITNTPTVEQGMRARYPAIRFRTILNGVDGATPSTLRGERDPFRIVYAGTIYLDRDPSLFFRAIANVVRRVGAGPQDLVVDFIGEASHYHSTPIHELAKREGIAEHLNIRGPLPRAALLEDLKGASMLVSLPQSTPWSMPSKIYEYMGFDAWMLVFAHRDSATATVLEGSNAIVIDPDDLDGTTEAILRCYEAQRRGVMPDGAADRERYARHHRGRELQALLRDIGWARG